MQNRTKDEQIKDKLAILREMQKAFETGKRLPNDQEARTAQALISQIEALEKGRNDAPLGACPDALSLMYDHKGETREQAQEIAYAIKRPEDKKDFRSLFGKGRSNYQWTDREIGFFEAVQSGRMHPDLTKRGMTIGSPSGGGFLVPDEQSKKIHNVALESEVVLPRCFVLPMAHTSIKIPAMAIGDHSNNLYGGFEGLWKGETSTIANNDPTVRAMELNANKLTGLVRYSNELFEDMPAAGEKQLTQICGNGLGFYRDRAMIRGTGAGQPMGLINAPCKIETSKEAGQTADTIVYENLVNMLGSLYAGGYQNAVWICHPSTIPSLLQVSMAIGTGGSAVQIMSDTGSGKYRILGLDVVFTEKASVVGDAGDIMLVDLTQYVVALRETLRIDLSQHVYFTTDEGAMRLISRVDGMPLWSEELTLNDGTTTVSPIITLEERT